MNFNYKWMFENWIMLNPWATYPLPLMEKNVFVYFWIEATLDYDNVRPLGNMSPQMGKILLLNLGSKQH